MNDKIKQIDSKFDLKQTNFSRFSDLAKKVEEGGHMTLGRKKETLHVEESKYYDADAPVRGFLQPCPVPRFARLPADAWRVIYLLLQPPERRTESRRPDRGYGGGGGGYDRGGGGYDRGGGGYDRGGYDRGGDRGRSPPRESRRDRSRSRS